MSTVGKATRKSLTQEFGNQCFYCELPAEIAGEMNADHFWPRSKKGCNARPNLVLACAQCNSEKANREPTLTEFYRLCDFRPNLSIDDLVQDISDEHLQNRQKHLNERKRASKERRNQQPRAIGLTALAGLFD